MGVTDQIARVVSNIVTIVVGLAIIGFIAGLGYLLYSCNNEVLNPPATSETKGR